MALLTQHTVNTPYPVGLVHFYSGEVGGELVLFDAGPPTDEVRQYLQHNLDLERLKKVFITHCHIDHWGQAAWLEEKYGATVFIPYRDALKLDGHQVRVDGLMEILFSLGFSEAMVAKLRKSYRPGSLFPPLPKKYLITEEHPEVLAGLSFISCPGHSQSDLVYVGDEWAVTGDTLLRGIFQSPLLDLDLVNGERFNNYGHYCQSIVKLASLRDKTVLPGHRKNIASIDMTLLFYITKLLARVEQFKPYREESNLIVIIKKLIGERMQNVFAIYLKASEIMFMKDLLEKPELIREALEKIGLFEEVAELYASATEV